MANKLDFETLRKRVDLVVSNHAGRDQMYQAMKKMLYMEWDDKPTADFIKPTMSPDPHNAIVGIVRLLVSTEPLISVARDGDDQQSVETADKLEMALKALWVKANRRRRWPVHYDVVLSAVLFSEVAVQIACVSETIRNAEVTGQDTSYLQAMAEECPYTFDVVDPTTVYPEFGAFGLRSVLHRYRRKVWEVREFWGKLADNAGVIGEDYDELVYSDYWDATWRCVWVNNSREPIVMEKHGLPFIPWVCSVAVGTGLFRQPVEQRIPMLYPAWKGHWWQRQNAMLTQLFTMTTLMANPTFVTETLDGQGVDINLSEPGGQVRLRPGEKVSVLQKMLIDSAVQQGLAIAEGKMTSSTLPRIVFGESPGNTMSYSAMNLLSQGGRLPLVPIEQQAGATLAEMFEKVLRWVEYNGEAVELYSRGKLARLETADINPAHIEVDVKLKADVPQDRLQLANVVAMLMKTTGADGLPIISRDTAMEFLGFMQAGDERSKVLSDLFLRDHLKQFIAEAGKQAGMNAQEELPQTLPQVQMTGQPNVMPVAPGGGEMMTAPEMPMGMEGMGAPEY
jgi:hypothetical protein